MAEVKKAKTISIKNRKEAKASLAKASIKGKKTTATKKTAKASVVKIRPKVTVKKEPQKGIVEVLENKEELEQIELNKKELEQKESENKKVVKKQTTKKVAKKETTDKPKEEKKKKTTIKEPNNIKRRIPKSEKEPIKEESKEEPKEELKEEKKLEIDDIEILVPHKETVVEKKPEKTAAQIKKEEKKKLKEKKRKEKRDKKAKAKAEKKKLKEKARKEKQQKKLEKKKNKNKIEYPKEWKTINSKNSKTVKEEPKTFKGKIKSSIFESIDEKELKERKKKSKESLKKTIIVLLIIVIIVGVIIYSLLKYNDFVKKQLAVYETFRIGDTVHLKNGSVWYVISDSDSSKDTVKLVSSMFIDVNEDGVINGYDVVKYNSADSTEFSSDDENSLAYLLENTIKERYEKNIGKIEEISILTYKEYVKVRERMDFGDEWLTPNFLAGGSVQSYWILSERNGKVYVVTGKGTFTLSSPNKSKFLRPTIVIKKDLVTKAEEKKKITVDLINGLKKK